MKTRIPLQISEGRLILTAVIECQKLRVHRSMIEFVIDTGSPESYLSNKDVVRFQIPTSGRAPIGEEDFGGSRFKKIELPEFDFYLLKEGKESKEVVEFSFKLTALNTTKQSEKNILRARALPSILGMNFLRTQKFSLHVVLTENIAYLEY